MPRPDTGNFNRFLSSLGLLLVAAALLVPYFYFQSSDTLTIPAKELNALTDTGRETLEDRQEAIASMELVVVGFAVALGVGGIFLLVFGGNRLRDAQVSEEEEDELRKSRARAEIQQLSPQQLEEKRDEQAKESAAGAEPPEPTAQAHDRRREADARYRRQRDAIARIEEKIAVVLSTMEMSHHTFASNVRVTSTSTPVPIELDGLFEALDEETHRDVIVEVRLWQDNAILPMQKRFADALFVATARYQAVLERPAAGWLVVVIPRDETPTRAPDLVQKKLAELLAPASIATVLGEDELGELPKRFTDGLLSSGLTELD